MAKIDTDAFNPDADVTSTVSFIERHANQRPDAVAIIENGREITYKSFYLDIARMVQVLDQYNLNPAITAAVEFKHPYIHWLVLLVAEIRGVVTLTFNAREASAIQKFLDTVDLLISVDEFPEINAGRKVVMDQNWIEGVYAQTPLTPIYSPPITPDTPLYIVKSSATTGQLKTMIRTAGGFAFRMSQCADRVGYSQNSRFLVSGGFNVQAFQTHAAACIRAGGTCIFEDQMGYAEALSTHQITNVVFLPHTLFQILKDMPNNYQKPKNLQINTSGSPISSELRRKVKEKLADCLIESYSSNEASVISIIGENGIGTIVPGVRVEVINDVGAAVIGQEGRIRVQSQGMVDGYLNDPIATAQVFREGWLYPGDLGIMFDDKTLKVTGRVDDLLNAHGIKLAPEPIEQKLLEALPVDDVCLLANTDKEDPHQVTVVLETDMNDISDDLKTIITSLLPSVIGRFKLVHAKNIPRTESGKIRRKFLMEAIARETFR